MGKHLTKKTAAAVRKGTQSTLKPCKPCGPLPRLLTPDEARELYHRALAEIWGVPVDRIRSHSYALPVITFYK